MDKQTKQALAVVKGCDGQEAILTVVGRGRGSYTCSGTLHSEGGRIDVSMDKDGYRHSLGVNVASLQSLEATVGSHWLSIRVRISDML